MLKGTAILTLGLGLSQFLSLLVNYYVIKILVIEDYANLIFLVFISTALSASLLSFYNRMVVINKSDIYLKDILIMLSLVSIFLFTIVFYMKQDAKLAFLACIIACGICIFEITKTELQSKGKFSKISFLSVLRTLFYFLIIYVFYYFDISSLQLIAISIGLVYFLCSVFFVKVNISTVFNFKKYVLSYNSFSLLIYFFCLPFLAQLPLLSLENSASSHEISKYGLAMTAILALNTIVISLKKVLIISLRDGVSKMKILQAVLFSGLVISFILIIFYFFGEMLFLQYSSNKLKGVNDVFMILAFSLIFTVLFSPFSELLQLRKKFNHILFALIFGFLISIFLTSIFDVDSAMKAAFVYTCSFSSMNFLMFILFIRNKYVIDS